MGRVENVFGSWISRDTEQKMSSEVYISNEIREFSVYHLPQPKEFFPSTMFEMFSSI